MCKSTTNNSIRHERKHYVLDRRFGAGRTCFAREPDRTGTGLREYRNFTVTLADRFVFFFTFRSDSFLRADDDDDDDRRTSTDLGRARARPWAVTVILTIAPGASGICTARVRVVLRLAPRPRGLAAAPRRRTRDFAARWRWPYRIGRDEGWRPRVSRRQRRFHGGGREGRAERRRANAVAGAGIFVRSRDFFFFAIRLCSARRRFSKSQPVA